MSKVYNVLIIDDHPLIIDAYKSALSHVSLNDKDFEFKIDTAIDCDTAYIKIINAKKGIGIDLIFLDIKLPPSKDAKILSGEDLGIIIKKLLDNVKIIVSTTFNENYRVNNIFKSINPDGFLIKNDVGPEDMIEAIKTVITDPPYYSKSVVKLLRKHFLNDILLDKVDRQLLYELSIGTKMKDLPNILPLSIAGVERRKRHLKEIFDVSKRDDKKLIQLAKEKGFI